MAITLNGTTGITTPDVTSDGSLKIDASAPDDSLVVDASGNLGLGVTPSAWGAGYTPIQGLGYSLYSGNAVNVRLSANEYINSGGSSIYRNNGAASLYAQAGDAHYWYTAPSGTAGNAISFTQAMTLDSSGNLLVGSTSFISGRLNVIPNNGVSLATNSIGTTDYYAAAFYHNSSLRGYIYTTGTNTTYSTTSDYRLKEDIQPMTGALAKVAALKPCTYKWKVDGSDGEGFIAHELQEVCPSAVTGEKDAVDAEGKPVYQGIDTSFLVATLTAAVQELKAINDAQAQTITAQQAALQEALGKIETLEARVAALEASNV